MISRQEDCFESASLKSLFRGYPLKDETKGVAGSYCRVRTAPRASTFVQAGRIVRLETGVSKNGHCGS